MKGLEEFLKVFGSFTVQDTVILVIAIIFIFSWYKKAKDFMLKKYEEKRKRELDLKEALDATRKYPEYREQSLEIQRQLTGEIQELKDAQKELRDAQKEISDHLKNVEEKDMRRECNKLRDRLLQNHRYYTNPETNPSQSWTEMEADAFWAMFKDYEDAGGDGYMHSEVQPDMERLTVVRMVSRH